MQDEKPVVVGLGEVLWDMLPGGKRFGGAPANFAYHAKALGGAAYVVSCVGADAAGEEILAELDRLGLSRQFVAVDAEHATGTVSVALDAAGKPNYVIHEGVAWDFIAPRPELLGLARRANAVCFGSLAQRSPMSRTTIRDFLAAAADDCLRVFDVNLRQHYYNADTVAVGLELADVLKLSDEEFPIIARLLGIEGDGQEILAALCRRYNLRLIALTRGADGSLLWTPAGSSLHPGFPAKVADTVGAGDAFTAAVVLGLLRHLSLDAINAMANRVAAYVCSQPGATPPMPEEIVGEGSRGAASLQ